jgi:hypothetical protein
MLKQQQHIGHKDTAISIQQQRGTIPLVMRTI